MYFIKGFISQRPHWRGLGKSHIYFRPRRQTWRIESFYDTNKYAEFFANEENPYDYWPTGRSVWNINEVKLAKLSILPLLCVRSGYLRFGRHGEPEDDADRLH